MTAILTFQDLTFHEMPDHQVRIAFLKHFYMEIEKEVLQEVGKEYKIPDPHTIIFEGVKQEQAERKFYQILGKHIDELKSIKGRNTATYVHKNSGIPLMGCLSFGIADKGTTLLEIKPITGCNMGCIFCSVDEGIGTRKTHEFVVEKDYLVQEVNKLLDYKKHQGMVVYINSHGEPFLYAEMVGLVADLKKNKWISEIHIITNGTYLTHELCDQLDKAGLTHLNISVSGFDAEKAKEVMGSSAYNIEKVKEIIAYLVKKTKIEVMITPVVMFGINEQEMGKIIAWAKQAGVKKVCIQNFLFNRRGRNPSKEREWEEFKKFLEELEREHGVKLLFDLKLGATKEYPKPFKRGEVVQAEIAAQGRYKTEYLAVAQQRCITLPKVDRVLRKGERVSVLITKSNHNIFAGEIVGKRGRK